MNTQEIKAGQRWERKDKKDDELVVVATTDKYVFCVFPRRGEDLFQYCGEKVVFLNAYKLKPEPRTRPITKDDIMKMLAVNPVLFCRHVSVSSSGWYLLSHPESHMNDTVGRLCCKYSHNPFAPNPVIVGPEIEVVE